MVLAEGRGMQEGGLRRMPMGSVARATIKRQADYIHSLTQVLQETRTVRALDASNIRPGAFYVPRPCMYAGHLRPPFHLSFPAMHRFSYRKPQISFNLSLAP